MSDEFRRIAPPHLVARTDAFEKKLRLGKKLFIGWAIFCVCSAFGVLYVIGHFVAKFW